jgi:GH24 family phage-related lysozyme (muramidase)
LDNDRYKTLRELLERHEGRHNKAYQDARGIHTIGVGASLRSPDTIKFLQDRGISRDELISGKRSLSDDEVNDILAYNIREKERYLPKDMELSDHKKAVLMSLAFQNPGLLGPSLRKGLQSGNDSAVLNEILLGSNRRGEAGVQRRRLDEARTYAGEGWQDYVNSIPDEQLPKAFGRLYDIKNEHTRKQAIDRYPILKERFERFRNEQR